MQTRILVPLFAIPLMLVAIACGDSGGGDDNGDTSASTSSSGGNEGGGGTMNTESIHDCDSATAVDKTSESTVTISFPGFAYDPSCVRVKAGTQVVFKGDFTSHPLVGGEYRGTKMPDDSSPIKKTTTGMEATFTLDTAGTYPYYCDFHASSKMYGAIFVE